MGVSTVPPTQIGDCVCIYTYIYNMYICIYVTHACVYLSCLQHLKGDMYRIILTSTPILSRLGFRGAVSVIAGQQCLTVSGAAKRLPPKHRKSLVAGAA